MRRRQTLIEFLSNEPKLGLDFSRFVYIVKQWLNKALTRSQVRKFVCKIWRLIFENCEQELR